jgi:hypothetical protein
VAGRPDVPTGDRGRVFAPGTLHGCRRDCLRCPTAARIKRRRGFVIRGDLADRALPLLLETIPRQKRRHEAEFWQSFEAAAGRILGALLDAVANGLKHLPTTELPSLPRMADFALWITACETGAPWAKDKNGKVISFMEAYTRNRAEATQVVLEDDHVAQALRKAMADRPEWEGTATELLARLTETWGDALPDKWPRGSNALTNRLRRIMPQLAATGLVVKFPARTKEARLVKITKAGDDTGDDHVGPTVTGDDHIGPTVTEKAQVNQGGDGDDGGDGLFPKVGKATTEGISMVVDEPHPKPHVGPNGRWGMEL